MLSSLLGKEKKINLKVIKESQPNINSQDLELDRRQPATIPYIKKYYDSIQLFNS